MALGRTVSEQTKVSDMRTVIAALSTLCVLSILLVPMTGCGKNGGRKTAPPLTAEEAKAKGMVEDPANPGSWMYPSDSDPYDTESSGYGDDGYGDEDSGGNDEYADNGYGDEAMGDDGYGDDGYGDEGDASNDNGGDPDPYATGGNGYGDEPDPYATGGNNGYGDEPDPYAVGPNPNNNDGYGDDGYGDDAYGDVAGGGSGVFHTKIVPILRARCYNCHGGGPRGRKGDLELHTAQAVEGSGMVVPRSPDESELYVRITMDDSEEEKMPPRGPRLTPEEVDTIRAWIQSGAPYGDTGDDGYGNDAYDGAYAAGGYGQGGDGGRPAPPPKPKHLGEEAMRSFLRGNDAEAMNQLFAVSLLADSEVAKDVLGKYGWVKGLKRSKLAVRWGVGIKYRGKDGWKGSPRPTGVEQDLPGDRSNDRGGDDEEVATDFSNRTLDYYGGDVGDELVLRLQMRIERGYYGEILKDAVDEALSQGDDEDGFGGGGYGRGGGDGYGGGGYGGGGYGGGGRGDDDDEKPDSERIEQIMPGVTMIGESHSLPTLMDRAKQQGVDVLVILDVTAEANHKLRIVNNTTRVRLYEVGTGEQVAVSGSIKNVEIQKAGPEDQTIIDEMDKIFKVADADYKLDEFPAKANPATAIKLVQGLLSQQTNNPLWQLSEVKFYHDKGLLKDTHLASAFKRVAPQQAAKLEKISDEAEIRKLLGDWMVVEMPGRPLGDRDDEDDEYGEEDSDGDRRPRRAFR